MSGTLLAAAMSAGAAGAALWGRPAPGIPAAGRPPPTAGRIGRRVGVAVPGVLALVLWLLGVGTIAAASAGAVGVAVARGRTRRRAARQRAEQALVAVEACGVLVDELRSGRHPVEALAAAAAVDARLARCHAAALAGTDVPNAFRAVGAAPAGTRGTGTGGIGAGGMGGRGSYEAVGAAWQVAHRHGAALAPALERVVAQLRAERSTVRVVASELASARATARLLVGLPFFALLAGAASGGRPWEFLLRTPVGQGCLGLGLLLGWAGLRWIDAIADAVAGEG